MLGTVYIPAEEFETGFLDGRPDTFNKTASFANLNISITAGVQYVLLLSTDVTEANYRIYGDRSGYAGGDWLRSQNGAPFTSGVLSSDIFFRVNLVSAEEPTELLGDCNLDGDVNFLDISSLISIICCGQYLTEADINEDSIVDFRDISPFIFVLSSL